MCACDVILDNEFHAGSFYSLNTVNAKKVESKCRYTMLNMQMKRNCSVGAYIFERSF